MTERGCGPRSRGDHDQACVDRRPIGKRYARRPSVRSNQTRDGLTAHDFSTQRDHARHEHLNAACGEGPPRFEVDVTESAVERRAGLDAVWEDRAGGIARAELDCARAEGDVVRV